MADKLNGKTPVTAAFDLDKLSGQDLNDLAEAERGLKLVTVAGILARVVTETSLGKADDPQTYLTCKATQTFVVARLLGEAFAAEAGAEKN